MPNQTWKVVGGADKGGILVREGKETTSPLSSDRLATDSLVTELALEDGRLQYELLTGTGPNTGWVSIKLKDKLLLETVEDAIPALIAKDTVPASEAISTSWKPPPVSGRKTRIVCLHGTSCGEKIFKMQLSKLVPKAKDIEFIFVEGTLKIDKGPAYETMQKFFPGMPNFAYDEVYLDAKGWRAYKDPKGTLETLQSQLRAHAPVDGLLGFSQGANFCVMLAAQAAAGVGAPVGFTVLLCPNAPGYVDQLPEFFTQPLPMPTLIVRGEKEGYGAGMESLFDKAIQDGSLSLDTRGSDVPADHVAKLCTEVEMVAHPEAHRPLPGDKKTCEEVVARIISFAAEKSK